MKYLGGKEYSSIEKYQSACDGRRDFQNCSSPMFSFQNHSIFSLKTLENSSDQGLKCSQDTQIATNTIQNKPFS